MAKVTISGKLKNKSNNYRIRVHPQLLKRIGSTVKQWRAESKTSPWWISPSDEVKAFEEEVAWTFANVERSSYQTGELELHIVFVNQPHDLDAIKSLCDAIQKSGRIGNDKQFSLITIRRRTGPGKLSIELEIAPLRSNNNG